MIIKRTPKYGSNLLSYSNGVEYFTPGVEYMYIMSRDTSTSTTISTYDMNGVFKSSFSGPSFSSSICVDDDSNAYVRTATNSMPSIYKYNQDGLLATTTISGSSGPTDPAMVYSDGYIYSTGNINTVAKFDKNLNKIWEVPVDSTVYAMAFDNTSIYASTVNYLYKISKSGSISWTSSVLPTDFTYTIAVGSTGTVYVGGSPKSSAPYKNWSIFSATGSKVSDGYLSFTFSSPIPPPSSTANDIRTMTIDSSNNLYISSGFGFGALSGQPLIKCDSNMSIVDTEPYNDTLTNTYVNSRSKGIFIYNNNVYVLSNLSESIESPMVRIYDSSLGFVNQFFIPYTESAIIY